MSLFSSDLFFQLYDFFSPALLLFKHQPSHLVPIFGADCINDRIQPPDDAGYMHI